MKRLKLEMQHAVIIQKLLQLQVMKAGARAAACSNNARIAAA
jgi:hypothetical protein